MNRRKKKIKKKIINKTPILKENQLEINREFLITSSIYSAANEEVRNKILNECDTLLECFYCKEIFRSLMALRAHRINYCHSKDLIPNRYACESTLGFPKERRMGCNKSQIPQVCLRNNLSGSQFVKYLQDTPNKFNETNMIQYYNGLLRFAQIKNKPQIDDIQIVLQPIQNTNVAVYQTILNSENELDNLVMIGDQIEELYEIEKNTTYFYNTKQKLNNNKINCDMCDRSYRTSETLSYHFERCHAKKRVYHPCPICKMNFPNHHFALKHIIHVHHKQIHQLRKLRPLMKKQIFEKVFTDYEIENFLDSNNPPEVINNQNVEEIDNYDWMKSLEQDMDIQKCGGCGIRFERRAALMSHSQFCQLRIAAKNKYTRIY